MLLPPSQPNSRGRVQERKGAQCTCPHSRQTSHHRDAPRDSGEVTTLPVQDTPWHRCGQGQVCRVRQRHRHSVGLTLFTSHTHLTALYNQAQKVKEDPLGGRPRGKAGGQVPTEAQP